MTKGDEPKPRAVRFVQSPYQPSKKELEGDLRVAARFDEAVDALARPVRVREVSQEFFSSLTNEAWAACAGRVSQLRQLCRSPVYFRNRNAPAHDP